MKKILFSGGGTLGSVVPLLSMYEAMTETEDVEAVWVGTKEGIEREKVQEKKISYYSLLSAKWRRYRSLENIRDIFVFLYACLQAFFLLRKVRPDICITAGSFVSVPVHVAAKILGIPTWVHQLDVEVGLANRMMARFATQITSVTDVHEGVFPQKRWLITGNPLPQALHEADTERAYNAFSLHKEKPVLLVLGGGTGAQRINELLFEALEDVLRSFQIVHLTGKGKDRSQYHEAAAMHPDYHCIDFLGDALFDLYAVADVIISRGGFGVISELAAMKKAVLFIPKTGHQEQNVDYLVDRGAAGALNEMSADANLLIQAIETMTADQEKQQFMQDAFHDSIPEMSPVAVRFVLQQTLTAQKK